MQKKYDEKKIIEEKLLDENALMFGTYPRCNNSQFSKTTCVHYTGSSSMPKFWYHCIHQKCAHRMQTV